MATIPSEKELLQAACHFGHRRDKWNPRIAPYIYGTQKGIHIFDLVQTRQHLETTCEALSKLQKEGKTILLVSTKQQSTALLEDLGKSLGQPFVTKKWVPGLLTNWNTMKKRLKYYLDLKNSFKTGEIDKYTKKEQTALRKEMAKLEIALGGVADMNELPSAVFIVDAVRDHVALKEANKLRIPVYGICDSNADPRNFAGFIPANDDAVKSIALILQTVQSALGGKSGTKKAEAEEDEEV